MVDHIAIGDKLYVLFGDVHECDAVSCEDSQPCDSYYCPRPRGLAAGKEYIYPYAFGDGNQFTFGVEIELEAELSEDFADTVAVSELIAGYDHDPSLGRNGMELQSNILDMSKLPALQQLVEGIPEYGKNAGGHIHVSRTPNQCASRWYWALRGLDAAQCRLLNMRHLDDDYWCTLSHGEYTGKHTAVNDEHADTIELRTFDCWYKGSASKLVPAVKWVRAMWRFFEKHPRGTVSASLIERYASCMADNVTDTPTARSMNDSMPHDASRRPKRSGKIRRNVEANVGASRIAHTPRRQRIPQA